MGNEEEVAAAATAASSGPSALAPTKENQPPAEQKQVRSSPCAYKGEKEDAQAVYPPSCKGDWCSKSVAGAAGAVLLLLIQAMVVFQAPAAVGSSNAPAAAAPAAPAMSAPVPQVHFHPLAMLRGDFTCQWQ